MTAKNSQAAVLVFFETLNNSKGNHVPSVSTIEPSCGLYYASPPQHELAGQKSWITRSANVVVVISQVKAGAELSRDDNPDEYMLLLPPKLRIQVTAGGEIVEAGPETLTIVPPGQSTIRALEDGLLTRVFTVRANDLAARADNASVYAQGTPSVAALEDWPAPPEGGWRGNGRGRCPCCSIGRRLAAGEKCRPVSTHHAGTHNLWQSNVGTRF